MRQPRILLFCHDGRGLGHLRRISRIAASLQGPFACLIVTGMVEAHWMVPPQCEWVRIPNWDSLSPFRAQRVGKPLWLKSRTHAESIRRELLLGIERAYRPDLILIDYLPFGQRDELRSMLEQSGALKYLVHRGLVDTSDSHLLCGDATAAIGHIYDRIVVTADRKIVDVPSEYRFVAEAAAKVSYVGYINPLDVAPETLPIRRNRSHDRPKIVCATGGGVGGELLLTACVEAARALPQFDFAIALGPHGTLPPQIRSRVPRNCHLYDVCPNLDALHQEASVVVTHGGYNSVMEAMSGGARILVHHIQGGADDERIHLQQRLAPHYPITSLARIEDLADRLQQEADLTTAGPRPRLDLEFFGIARIGALVRADLGMTGETLPEVSGWDLSPRLQAGQ